MQKPLIFDFASALEGQARLRLWLVFVLVTSGLGIVYYLNKAPRYAITMGLVHFAYAGIFYIVGYRLRHRLPRWTLYLTAVLDALMLTGWAVVVGRLGQLLVPLYIFSSIGYGMRTGSKRIMHVSQAVSVLGLVVAPLFAPYWRENMTFWLSSLLSIVLIPGYVGILMDKLNLAITYAESENQAKSDLLARVSHELRTPLGGISNAAELLQVEAIADRPRQLAATILSLSAHLLADINDLLDQSKLSLRKLHLTTEPIDLSQQVEVVRASVEANARKKGLDFISVIDPRIVDCVVGDTRWLARVLINLLGNAVKFTDFGSVSLNISLLHDSPTDYLIRFSVKDTGIGIPKELQEKIFDPFVQLSTGTSSQNEGAGLGLAISKQVVELMGGALRVSGDVAMGSTFWFDLRMSRAKTKKVEQTDLEAATVTQGGGNADRQRLLIVDDNETNCYLLQELLQKEGHSVVTASSGEDALQILSNGEHFDLLLLDYNLGEMDGSVVLQTYRFGRRHPAPAYFLTADATGLTAEKLKNTGALGVLTKPVRAQELRQAIEFACGTTVPGQDRPSPRPGFAEKMQTSSSEPTHLRPVPIVFIDMAVINRLKQIGTRRAFFKELLERADADIAQCTAHILETLSEENLRGVRDAAHALKGVSMETGAMRLMNMALGLMRADDSYLIEQKLQISSDLLEASKKTREALQNIIAESMQQAAGF